MVPLAVGLAAGAGLLGQGLNAYTTGRMNKRAERFSREMYAQQRQDALSDWNMQNAYNDPSAQMARLKAAGLNPNLVYGNGAAAQVAQSAPRSSQSHQPRFQAPQFDLGGVAFQALQAKQLQSNISRTDAETDAIRQRTAVGQFELEAMRQIGQSSITKQMEAKVQNATNQEVKKIREFQTWLDVAFSTSPDAKNVNVDSFGAFPAESRFVSDSVTTAVKKAVLEAENIKSGIGLRNQQQAIQELQKVILQAEADFIKSFGSKTGAGMALQLLRLILGK